MDIIHGSLTESYTAYRHISLEKLVGKTIEAIAVDEVEGAYGMEPMTILLFTDKTKHGFVHPTDLV